MIPNQHIIRILIADPVAQSAMAQINGLVHLSRLLRVPVVDLVGWWYDIPKTE